jgi:serine/threonine protein kinase
LHAQVAQKIFRYDDFEYTLIGEGFFAQVYRARHKTQPENSAGGVLALKRTKSNIIPQADQSRNILRERLILEKLKSPFILRFEGVCLIDNHIHVFTEYVNGGSLEKLIQNHAFPLSWKTKTKLASDISNGLTYLHDKKIFHRDVTSRNCLVKMSLKNKNQDKVPDELHSAVLNCYDFPRYFEPVRAVLADFGLAEKIEEEPEDSDDLDSSSSKNGDSDKAGGSPKTGQQKNEKDQKNRIHRNRWHTILDGPRSIERWRRKNL